jgi:GMP synthase-like glutamine amidotransferase
MRLLVFQHIACEHPGAMRVGEQAWSMQYHVELVPETFPTWGRVPAYERALTAAQGAGAIERMADADERLLVCLHRRHRPSRIIPLW